MISKKELKIKNFADCARFYNYKPTTKLLNTVGIEDLKLPYDFENMNGDYLDLYGSGIDMGIDGVVYVKQFYEESGNTQHRLLVHAKDKKIYINQMFNHSYDLFWLYNLTFETAPISLTFKKNGQDAIILASETEMKIWKTGYSPYTIPNVPIITSMCVNEGVLFCTIKKPAFKIWYATDLDAENVGNISKNSGYISLEDDLGNAGKIITFNQDVYVFREYGISKINFVKKEISVTQIYKSNTRIFANITNVFRI